MTGFLGILVAAVVGGAIQRNRSTDEARWRYTRVWMLVLSSCIAIVGGRAVLGRGWSKSSLAMAGVALVLMGSALHLLFDAERPKPADDGWNWVAWRATQSSGRSRGFCVTWGVLTLLFLTAALRYGGAFVHEAVLEKIGTVAALGQFEPLRARKPVGVGQCLEARDIHSINDVGACSLPHRSELVGEVDTGKPCGNAASYRDTGLDLKVVTAGPFDGSLYCVLQSSSPKLRWVGRVFTPPVPETL